MTCISDALEKRQYSDLIRETGFKSINIVSKSTFTDDETKGKITILQVEAKNK